MPSNEIIEKVLPKPLTGWDYLALLLGVVSGTAWKLRFETELLNTFFITNSVCLFSERVICSLTERWRLKRKGRKLRMKFVKYLPDARDLLEKWEQELDFYEDRIISSAEFKGKLKEFTDHFRQNKQHFKEHNKLLPVA